MLSVSMNNKLRHNQMFPLYIKVQLVRFRIQKHELTLSRHWEEVNDVHLPLPQMSMHCIEEYIVLYIYIYIVYM